MIYILALVIIVFSFYRFIMNIGVKYGYAWGPIDAVFTIPAFLIIMGVFYISEVVGFIKNIFTKKG